MYQLPSGPLPGCLLLLHYHLSTVTLRLKTTICKSVCGTVEIKLLLGAVHHPGQDPTMPDVEPLRFPSREGRRSQPGEWSSWLKVQQCVFACQ